MTLQEKYTAIQEGKFSKEQFKRDAVHSLPKFVTKFNSYDEVVQILKNKGMLHEEVEDPTIKEGMSYEEAVELARTESEGGFVQHVNKLSNGTYQVEDWYDSDNTVASYQNGRPLGEPGMDENEEAPKRKVLPNKNKYTSDTISIKSSLENVIKQAWAERDLERAKKIVINYLIQSKVNDFSKKKMINNVKSTKTKQRLDQYLANSLLNFERLGIRETTLDYGTDYDNPYGDLHADRAANAKALKLYDEGEMLFRRGKVEDAEELRQQALEISDYDETDLPPYGTLSETISTSAVDALIKKEKDTKKKNKLVKIRGKVLHKQKLNKTETEFAKEVGLLSEELSKYKEEKGSKYEPAIDNPEDAFSFEDLQRGVDYELEAAGFDSASPETFTEEDVEKAKKKALKNLEKNRLHYLNLLAGESDSTDHHDQLEPVKKDNHVDTYNGLKKAELKEAIKKLIVKSLGGTVETLTEGRVQRMWEVGRAYPGYGKALKVEGERSKVTVEFHTGKSHLFEIDSESGIWQEVNRPINENDLNETHHIDPETFEHLHGMVLTKAEEAMSKAAKLIARDLQKDLPDDPDLIRNFILVLLDKHLQNQL